MKTKPRMIISVFLAAFCLAGSVRSEDNMRIVNAIIFPGVPQLADGNIGKGLLFVSGEIALLTCSFSQISRSYSYARETEYLKVQYDYFDSTKTQQQNTLQQWSNCITKQNASRARAIAFGVSAGLWWALSITDAFIFRPKRDSDPVSIFDKIPGKLTVGTDLQGVSLSYSANF